MAPGPDAQASAAETTPENPKSREGAVGTKKMRFPFDLELKKGGFGAPEAKLKNTIFRRYATNFRC